MKCDLFKIFLDEIYTKSPKVNYETNKIIYNHIDEIKSIDLADFAEFKTPSKRRHRCLFVIIDIFGNYSCPALLKKN